MMQFLEKNFEMLLYSIDDNDTKEIDFLLSKEKMNHMSPHFLTSAIVYAFREKKLKSFECLLKNVNEFPEVKKQLEIDLFKKLDFSKHHDFNFVYAYELAKHRIFFDIPKFSQLSLFYSEFLVNACLLAKAKEDLRSYSFLIKNYIREDEQVHAKLREMIRLKNMGEIKKDLILHTPEVRRKWIRDKVEDQPKYNSIQCIGFKVVTAYEPHKYVGLMQEQEDANGRLKIMQEAIHHAMHAKHVNSDARCLKVFLAPEFYFRGSKGAYGFDIADSIVHALREMVQGEEYKDWLFSFGTIVSHARLEDIQDQTYEAYNYSFIQKGNRSEKDSVIVMKENKSAVDFLEDPGSEASLCNKNTQYMISKTSGRNRTEAKQKNYDGNAFFEVDGIGIGVEICKDNLEQRISNSDTPEKSFQLQLVPSCGLGSAKISSKISAHGYVFLCDGTRQGEIKLTDQEGKRIHPNCQKFLSQLETASFSKHFKSAESKIEIFPVLPLEPIPKKNLEHKKNAFEIQ